MMRRAVAWAVLGLSLASCPPPATCDPTLCAGCCDSAGICRSGLALTQCGAKGERCAVCKSGESCQSGACVQTRFEPDGGQCSGVQCMRGTTCDPSDGVCRCGGNICGASQRCDAGVCVNAG